MMTHKGSLSGRDSGIHWFSASVNQGNSGGALCLADGTLVGVVFQRAEGVLPKLGEYMKKLGTDSSGGGVQIGGVDHFGLMSTIVADMDRHISVGFGAALEVNLVRAFFKANPQLLD